MIIQVLITGALILGFLKLADKENVMDFFGSCTIYLAPLVTVSVLDFTIGYFELPAFLHIITFSLFLVIPYLIINAICETYTTKKSASICWRVRNSACDSGGFGCTNRFFRRLNKVRAYNK